MSTPSTADSHEGRVPDRPVVEPGAQGPSGTRPVVNGEPAPRLPHERDESSDSGTRAPNELMRKAAADASAGRSDPPRGPEAQRRYSELTQRATAEAAASSPAGDEAPEGTPQTGKNVCPDCGGSGQVNGAPCAGCDGTGTVTVNVGDA